MIKFAVIAAAFVLAVSNAQACEFQRSAEADKVDQTTVASVALPQSEPVKTDATVVPTAPAEELAK